ncbi:MAG: DNRLRE domain-containing protein [Chloroflexi bacterium]|nr:DNRLRE domain-containing protein [Chloroflexota bacterium]
MNTHLFFRRIALLVAVCAGVIVLGDVSKQTGIISAAPKAPAGSATYTAVADATIKQSAPDLNYGSAPTLDVLHGLEGSENGAALIRFDISALPSDATIDSAYLQLYLESGTGLNPVDLSLRIVTSSWNESTVTWNTAPAATPGWITWSMDATPGYKTTIDLSGWVAYWMTLPNYGVQLSGPTSNLFTRTFSSREGYNAAPSLVVNYHRPPTVMSGHIYVGDVGDTSTPLPGIEVALYCSSGANVQGDLVDRTDTDAQGAYTVGTTSICEYYNVMSFAPPGYYSLDATSSAGIRRSPTWIQYLSNQTAHTYTGDAFWDKVTPPVDNTPPGFWANFAPTQWVNTQTVPASEQVADTLSGLRVASAQFRYSVTGGETWSNWHGASITGADGTTSPQTISANVPFGHDSGPTSKNWVQFQVADMQGNPGTGPTHAINVDSIPPQNPTGLSSSTHTPGVWSNNPQVTAQWSGATDDRSGLKGYSVAWDHSSTTVPGVFVATSGTSFTNNASADSPDWWFHVRSIDQAGNAAVGAKHLGPFKIDTTPPMVFLTAPTAGAVATATFIVSWSGTDASGIASYDVQTNTDGGAWSAWLTGVTYQSATFAGQRGHTHYFRARAHDLAGNVSGWSSSGWAKLGTDIVVTVRYESGVGCSTARVYNNDTLVGWTNGQGQATAHDVLVGDQLSALCLVYEHTAARPDHDRYGYSSGKNWDWRAYQTSIDIDNDGNPHRYAVTSGTSSATLTVRKKNALIGMHTIFSVLWDANTAYLNDFVQGVRSASALLYDVTDGQMFFEVIEIFDNREHGDGSDAVVYPSNDCGIGDAVPYAITQSSGRRIHLARSYCEDYPGKLNYGMSRLAAATVIHEFGHDALGLGDEYYGRNGEPPANNSCTPTGDPNNPIKGCCTINWIDNPSDAERDRQGSIMNDHFRATELCSRADPAHPHNAETDQDGVNPGETTWETLIRHYGTPYSAYFQLQSPDTRHVAVVPGPSAFPVPSWIEIHVGDKNTGVCSPYTQKFLYASSPAKRAEAWVNRPDGIDLHQGFTNDKGEIAIYGAHTGDTVHAKLTQKVGETTVTLFESSEKIIACPATTPVKTLAPMPFTLTPSILPLGANLVQVQVQASSTLPSAPQVVLSQDGLSTPISVTLTYNSALALYTGQAMLSTALEPAGQADVQATDSAGGRVAVLQSFRLLPVKAAVLNLHLFSRDAQFALFLPPGSLIADTVISIQNTTIGSPAQGNLVLVGSPYQVITASGQSQLKGNGTINITYPAEQAASVRLGTLQLYRWDEAQNRWVAAGRGTLDTERRFVSTQIDHLSVFALLGERVGSGNLYLPLVRR